MRETAAVSGWHAQSVTEGQKMHQNNPWAAEVVRPYGKSKVVILSR
ncbi:MAG: hypothetical protein ACI4K9_05525 [Candidatus Fimenecus sp.]